jgi:hypothetical protein
MSSKQGLDVQYFNKETEKGIQVIQYGEDDTGTQTLAQVLAQGNTTEGNDIILSTGDSLVGEADVQISAAAGSRVIVNPSLQTLTQYLTPEAVANVMTSGGEGAIFVSDGTGGLIAGALYYLPDGGAPFRLDVGGGSTPDEFSSVTDDSLVPGQAVYVKGSGNFGLADSALSSGAAGLSLTTTAPTFSATIKTGGIVTIGDWTAVIGVASLTPGATYFVGSSGGLTTVPPATGYLTRMGSALSLTQFRVGDPAPVKRG